MLQKKHLMATAIVATLVAPSAFATNGMFSDAYGTKSKGMAGATTALPQDTMAAATNPAGMVFVGNGMDMGAAVFSPRRKWESERDLGPGLAPSLTTRESGKDWFLIPSFGYNKMLDDTRSVGIDVFGNGGMNTDYRSEVRPIVPFNLLPLRGSFGDGRANIDLEQLFIEPTYSQKLTDDVSVGISPILAVQRFRAKGLTRFRLFTADAWDAPGILPHPWVVNGLDDNGYDWSYGGGVKAGIQANVSPTLSLGAAVQSKMYMSKFSSYDDLFANNGDLDIPATVNVGLAYKPVAGHTFTFDVQDIFYSDVKAIGNPSTDTLIGCLLGKLALQGNSCFLGGSNGAGFGWSDMVVYKAGWQWEYSDRTTARLGFSYGKQPIPSRDVVFNILAPATIEEHVTAGLTRKLGENNEINLALTYALPNSVEGRNPFGLGSERVKLTMHQWDLEMGWAWKW